MAIARPIELTLRILISGLLIMSLTVPVARADKTDVVLLVNGNSITGEIKSLDFGKLRYSTDSMGTVQIDWEDVVAVTSNQSLLVELTDGRRYFGSLQSNDARQVITVAQGKKSDTMTMMEVVRITPIDTDESILARLEGSISFGFSSQKASEVTTLNVSADVRYRTLKYLLGYNLFSTITNQPSEETKARQVIGTNYQRFRDNRWFTDWFAQAEQNDELGIESRVLVGGALGRYLVQTNLKEMSLTGGLVATRESFIGDQQSTTNAEGRIQAVYRHRILDPDTSLSFKTEIFPLLEDLSSIRTETDLSFKREFIDDLYFDVTIYHSYATDPPPEAASTDYGITTSLGYSF
jgi:putative salt-induced outer membrane protein YdiY